MADPVRYRVDLSARRQHLVRVTVSVPDDLRGQHVRLVLPTWTPGSYVVRNYVHDVQAIEAAVDGEPVTLTPDGHSAWTLDAPADGATTVTLEVHGHSPSVRTNHIDDHHALLIPPATFPWIVGATDRPHDVVFDGDERIWSMLPVDGGVHRATDYLHLVDTAFEVGDHESVTWQNAGVDHRFVWSGREGAPDLNALSDDASRVIDAAIELFGGDLPVDAYTFLCFAWDRGGGGLEHRDGATLLVPAHSDNDVEARARLVSLIAHEYLHLWNVKRLTPAALVRPDLEQPTHTPSLWVAEGWTSYWDELLPMRAGLWDADRWLKALAENVDVVTQLPGRARQNLHEASHQAWVKHYIRDENTPNAGTDYYRHGGLVAFALDMELRRRGAEEGLDGVARLLWSRHGRSQDGYTEDDVEDATSTVAGADMAWFFEQFVAGRELPDVVDLAGTVGIHASPSDPASATPWLGVHTSEAPTGLRINASLRGGPAWDAGIVGDDVLIAIDGHAVDTANLEAVLRAAGTGVTVTCQVLRGPSLLPVPVTLAEPVATLTWKWAESVDATTNAHHQRWAGRPHPAHSG